MSLHLVNVADLGRVGAEQQLALATDLLRVLDTEFTALQAGDASALAAITADKTKLLKSIDPQAPTRMAPPQREKFAALVKQAQEQNRRNGEYVATQQAYVRARWAGLSSIAGQYGMYNADGMTARSGKTSSGLVQV